MIDDFNGASADPLPIPLAAGLTGTFVAERNSLRWQRASALVAGQYAQRFGASLNPDYPFFLGIDGAGNLPSAVIGARLARESPIFCESYLDQDLATLLASKTGEAVTRDTIAELGNLAIGSRQRQRLIPLMRHVQQWTLGQDCSWIVFCLTRQLRTWFEHLGIEMIFLAPARADRIGSAHDQWGSYYQHDPIVLAARVHQTPGFERPAP
ncbi:MAG: thermostable hemolysin [Wenzhouxiangellaceae bacterium]|nr:thermostable hemolysin [Wenzhouxiangellaceae bacterium]